jgi:hypothetical protein
VSHWEVINLHFCWQAWIWTWVLTSLMSSAPFPLLVPVLQWVPLCILGLHPDLLGGWIPLWIKLSIGTCGISWQSRQMHLGDKVGDNSPSPQSQRNFQEMLWEFASWDTGLEAISRKQHFIVLAQTQWTHVQRPSPDNKGVSPYRPLQAGYRSKKQGLIHIWLYLIVLATLS